MENENLNTEELKFFKNCRTRFLLHPRSSRKRQPKIGNRFSRGEKVKEGEKRGYARPKKAFIYYCFGWFGLLFR